LAEDIAERGLLQPIVLDSKGRILDGRNRYAACDIAGVKPEFATYEGDDPDGYALAVNLARRNMSKGQMAMVLAGGAEYNNYTLEDARRYGVSKQYVSWARLVLDHDDLRRAVLADTMKLAPAYEEALRRKEAVDSVDEVKAQLRAEAPDLADEIAEERLTLEEALGALQDRRQDAIRQECVAKVDEVIILEGHKEPTFAERVEQGHITWNDADTLSGKWLQERSESIDRDAERVRRITASWGALRDVMCKPDRPRTVELLERLSDVDREILDQISKEITFKKKV
jgi:hypothetical protein